MTTSLDTTASTDRSVFGEIVALFDDKPVCEIKTAASRCHRSAAYMTNCHGCAVGLICTKHLRAFAGQTDPGARVECNHCGREFASLADAYTATPL